MSGVGVEVAEQPVVAAPEPQHAPRFVVNDVVPVDPWYYIRLAFFTAFGVGYLWWFFAKGLIVDRISVAISVGIFIVIGHLGRPVRRWGWLLFDCVCYCGMWLAYEQSRGWADRADWPLQVEMPRNVDRFLFLGTDPTVWLQHHFYDPFEVHWYDKVASATYFSHFIFPVIAIAVVWVTSHREWARFIKRFASVLFVVCTMFVLMPTVPPWMAADRRHFDFGILPPLTRHTAVGFRDLGLKGFVNQWQSALDWGNPVAAMPSLHAAFALFVPAFFLPRIPWRWLKAVVLVFPVMMLTSLVYFGEHYVIDGLVGWLIVGLSFLFWGWHEKRMRRVRADRARAAHRLAGAGVKVRPVLLDAGFLHAVLDTGHPRHQTAATTYLDLVERFEAGTDRLLATSDVLGSLPMHVRRGALAPVETLWIAWQHRVAARGIIGAPTDEVAMTLVMLQRERIRAVATLDQYLDGFDVEVVAIPDGDVSFRTEPLPDRQPTA